MQHSLFFRIAFPVLGIFLLFAAGCAITESARFYTLSPLANPPSDTSAGAAGHDLAIGIGPIEFPEYLKGPRIVTRTTRNKLELAEFDRWAGSLEKDFARVLAENLSKLLSTDHISIYPWRSSVPVDYQVVVEVIQFDGKPGESASIVARWNISGANGKELLLMRRSSFIESATQEGYDAMVEAKSEALADLSRDIAAAISDVSKNN